MNTVDSAIATLMIKCYEEEEGKYEWMDIFDRLKNPDNKHEPFLNPICLNNFVTLEEISTIRARLRCVMITQAKTSHN